MPAFDPKELLKRVIQPDKEPTTFQPTIRGIDVRRPGSIALSLLRKALRDDPKKEKPKVEEKKVEEKKVEEKKDEDKEEGPQAKTGTDQAPRAPLAPGPMRVKDVKAQKVEGPVGIEVSQAFDAEKPYREKKSRGAMPDAARDVKKQDVVLWKAYKAKPTATTLRPLMTAMKPLMHSEVNRWKASAPQPVLYREAQTLALHAINNFDPDKGAALGTHVMNRLKKLSRISYQNQDLVRLPENKKLRSQALYNATEELRNRHGRDPTNAELADQLVWSPKRVSDVQRSMVGEYIESQDIGGDMFSDVYGRDAADPVLDFIYYDLDHVDKQIFEHLTGYSGKPILSMSSVAMKLGLTESMVRSRKSKIIAKIKKAK